MRIISAQELYDYAKQDFITDELRRKAYLVPMKSTGAEELTKIEDMLVPIADPDDPNYHGKVGHFWFDSYTGLKEQEGRAANLLIRFAKHVKELDGDFSFPSEACNAKELEFIESLTC